MIRLKLNINQFPTILNKMKQFSRKDVLSFPRGNAKIGEKIYTFSLPAGWACPFARACLSKSDPITGKITDGEHTEFRCFAATMECRTSAIRKSRWNNYNLLKGKTFDEMVALIEFSIPRNATIIRVHVSGDFFNESYFKAWLRVALNNPKIVFYGYTKALSFLVKYQKDIPSNFRFTASYGGKLDHLIEKHNLKSIRVVYSVNEATRLMLPLDHDDSHAFSDSPQSFAILIHGVQPKGTPAAKAWELIKRSVGGYRKEKKKMGGILRKKRIETYALAE